MATKEQIDAAALALMDELYDGRASLPKDHPARLPVYGVCFKRARIALEAAEVVTMALVIKTFKNEYGNQIDLRIDDVPDEKSVIVRMRGPTSESVNRMTYREAAELRHALQTITH